MAQSLLTSRNVATVPLTSVESLMKQMAAGIGAVLIAEEALVGPHISDLQALVAGQAAWSDLPFVVLTNGSKSSRSDEEARRIDALQNAVLLSRPLHTEDLLRAVTSALKARSRQYEARGRLAELEEQEALLRRSEAQFHAIVNSIDQMIWSTLPDGYHDFYNDRWYEYTGVPAGSTDGEAWNGMFHPDDQERAWARWSHSLETGEPYEIEYRLRHRSGEYRWVLGKAQPVRGDDGGIVRWYGTCTDINDQVMARETLARSREDLEEAVRARTSKLRAVMKERQHAWNSSVDLLAIVRPDATIQSVNPAWKDLLGYEEEDLVGRNFLDFTHPDDVERTAAEFTLVFERPLIEPYEFRFLHASGSYRRFAWTASSYDGLAYPAGRDVTEEYERAEALAAAQEALRQSQKLETIGQLTGGVAHDFNNLLMAIRSSLELLQGRIAQHDERSAKLLTNAVKAAERGASLTQRMLAFARKQELDAKPVDVVALLSSMADLLDRSIGPQVEVTVNIDPDVADALVDANQLEMAILNLALNARDAMDGKGEVFLNVDCIEDTGIPELGEGAYIRIALRDTGPGMDTKTLSQALEPFFTTKGVGKGTGLGLSMVHGLAVQSGGTFQLRSKPGEGTTAEIYLPVAPHEPAQITAMPDIREASTAVGKLNILAVDDDALVLFGTAGMLEELGHEVAEATSGDEALQILAEGGPFDLVVTDQAMPNMTGIELAAVVHSDYPGIPVILASGYAEIPGKSGSLIAARLEKPFTDAMLKTAIEQVMGESNHGDNLSDIAAQ